MAYVFTFFIVSLLVFICFRLFKNKAFPSNNYTPDDDITFGKKIDLKQDRPLQDTKHKIEYAEKNEINEIIDKNENRKNT